MKKFHIFFCLLFVFLLSCKTDQVKENAQTPVVETIEWNMEEDTPVEESLAENAETPNQTAEINHPLIASTNIQFALQGESNGVRVVLNISDLPDQDITSTITMNMQIRTSRDITLNSLTDKLIISVNDETFPANLRVFNQGTLNIPGNSIFEFSVELTPDSTIDFLRTINTTKELILNSTKDPKKLSMAGVRSEILNLYKCQFKISNPSLTIPLDRVIITVE